MASCQPKIPGIEYKDEGWWMGFFTKDLAEFYSSLKGLLNAREALLKELSGDLAQVLADLNKRDLALKVLFGGLEKECLEKIEVGINCISPGKAAHLYRYVLGIGLGRDENEDLRETRGVLKVLKLKGLEEIGKERLGVSINDYASLSYLNVMTTIIEMKKLTDEIYSKVRQVVQVGQTQANYGFDLVRAFEDFLTKGIKLLPLYNPYTFFIQSLRSTPKPYLKVMYCDELFSDSVMNLMGKYGVELTKILDPDLSAKSVNDELAIVGHKDGSVGDLIIKLIWDIYDITYKLNRLGYPVNDELKEYIKAKYEEKIPTGDTIKELINIAKDVFNTNYKVEYKYCQKIGIRTDRGNVLLGGSADCGLIYTSFTERSYIIKDSNMLLKIINIKYEDFLNAFSLLLFLGIAWISKGDPVSYMYILH